MDSQFFQNHLLTKWSIVPRPSVTLLLACTGSHAHLALSPFHGWAEPSLGQCPSLLFLPRLVSGTSWTLLHHMNSLLHLWILHTVQSHRDLWDYSRLMNWGGQRIFQGLGVWFGGISLACSICKTSKPKTLYQSVRKFSPLTYSSQSISQLLCWDALQFLLSSICWGTGSQCSRSPFSSLMSSHS